MTNAMGYASTMTIRVWVYVVDSAVDSGPLARGRRRSSVAASPWAGMETACQSMRARGSRADTGHRSDSVTPTHSRTSATTQRYLEVLVELDADELGLGESTSQAELVPAPDTTTIQKPCRRVGVQCSAVPCVRVCV